MKILWLLIAGYLVIKLFSHRQKHKLLVLGIGLLALLAALTAAFSDFSFADLGGKIFS